MSLRGKIYFRGATIQVLWYVAVGSASYDQTVKVAASIAVNYYNVMTRRKIQGKVGFCLSDLR